MDHRELEALVAEHVFGLQWFTITGINVLVSPLTAEGMLQHPAIYKPGKEGYKTAWVNEDDNGYFFDSARMTGSRRLDDGCAYRRFPDFTSKMEDAWSIVKKMQENGWKFSLGQSAIRQTAKWRAGFSENLPTRPMPVMHDDESEMYAICIAALKAVGFDTKTKVENS